MTSGENYAEINKRLWNARSDIHFHSDFYNVNGFLQGKTSLNDIELTLLGDISGKSILHLQCHFGQDTISLARMGAKVTGVDLSDKAIERARALSAQAATDATFICCNLYDLPQFLEQKFDIVFTTYGTIGWLPDVELWAQIVSQFLKPGGHFLFADFHPVVWMFDAQFEKIEYRYFNSGPIVENESGTYTDKDAAINLESVGWNHGIGEVLTSLINNGLQLISFEEFDYAPYNCFRGSIESEPKKYRIQQLDDKIPMVYAILAVKK